MTIYYHNDGKQKYMSHEISVDSDYINEYGESKEEAIEMAKLKVLELIHSLQNINWDTDIIEINGMGRPIKNEKKL